MAKPTPTPAPSTITATTSAAPKATTPDPIDPIQAAVPAAEPQAEVAPEAAKPATVAKAKDEKSPVSIVLTEATQRKMRLVCHVSGQSLSRFVEEAIKVALAGKVKEALASLSEELD